MLNFVLFIFSLIGLSFIIVESTIFQPMRTWLKDGLIPQKLNFKFFVLIKNKLTKIVGCFQCTGFWSGVICGLLLVSFNPLIVFCCGCAGSFLTPLAVSIMNYIEVQTIINMKED